jgi:hypothetical protein
MTFCVPEKIGPGRAAAAVLYNVPFMAFLCRDLISTAIPGSTSACPTDRPIRAAQTAEAKASSMLETECGPAIAAMCVILAGFFRKQARHAAASGCQETFRKYPQKSAIRICAAPRSQLPQTLPGFGIPPRAAGTRLGAARNPSSDRRWCRRPRRHQHPAANWRLSFFRILPRLDPRPV